MAIEDLHDFPTLQIPQVDFAIFAARHDPLASGDTEAGADAVLGVLVADVRLQAARRLEVPETYGTVVGGGEDVFRVGRKLHVLAVEVNRFLFYLFIFLSKSSWGANTDCISYQMALCPSARVLMHCPDGRLHMRLRGRNN